MSLGLGGAGTCAVGAFGASEWALGCGAFLWDTRCCKSQNRNQNAHGIVIQ